jgi:hypothetical protein
MLRCYANLINFVTIKNPKNNGQFNTIKLGRSYTTTCLKQPFYSIELKEKKNKIKYNQLGAYIAGLIEGDGNIYTPRLNVKGYPQIEIAFDIKDVQLAKKNKQKIISVIGGGLVIYFLELMVKAVE